jgi:hypothetical protein
MTFLLFELQWQMWAWRPNSMTMSLLYSRLFLFLIGKALEIDS